MSPFLTVDQAAAMLQLHPVTVRARARSGQIPAMKMGKYWRFSESMLKRWIEGEIEPPTDRPPACSINQNTGSGIFTSNSTADVFAKLRALKTK